MMNIIRLLSYTGKAKSHDKSITEPEVLKERQHLEQLVDDLQKKVKDGLSKLEEIKGLSEKVKEHEAEININSEFIIEVTFTELEKIDISGTNTCITNCEQCHYTCHYPCKIPNDKDKRCCKAIGEDGFCEVCPDKCIWSVHFNQNYRWEYKTVTKKQTVEELKKKYEIALNAKTSAEGLISKLQKEFDDILVRVMELIEESSNCLNRLKEIAKKPDPLSPPQYINIIMKGEQSEAKPGWQRRVECLSLIRIKAEEKEKQIEQNQAQKVVKERQQLEKLVDELQSKVKDGLSKLEGIKELSEKVKEHEAEINKNSEFIIEVTVTELKKMNISPDTYVTNCQQCHVTCHYPCKIPKDTDKKGCVAMGQNGFCEVCPAKCIWSVHSNQDYRYEYKTVTKKQTVEELKKKYEIALNAKKSAEGLISKLQKEFDAIVVKVMELIVESSNCLNRLKEIAQQPDTLSPPQYINIIMKGEQSEAKPGWKRRVEFLSLIKIKAEEKEKQKKLKPGPTDPLYLYFVLMLSIFVSVYLYLDHYGEL